MTSMLEGKVAVVTGGGRGIGRSHCLELARHGAAVVVVDPGVGVHGDAAGEDPADEVVTRIEDAGGRAMASRGSVTSWSECREVVDLALDRFGRLDILVNNAGIVRDRMITSMAEDDWDQVVEVHLKGTFTMTKHACDHWRAEAEAGRGTGGRNVKPASGAGPRRKHGQSRPAAPKARPRGATHPPSVEDARHDVFLSLAEPRQRAYEAVDGYVAAHGLTSRAPARELYLGDWHQIAGTDPVVHVAQPIEE